MARIAIAAEATALFLLAIAAGGLLTYPAASSGFAYVGGRLAYIDGLLGFDWLGYVHWFDQSAMACHILSAAYDSIMIQPVIILFALAGSGQICRLQTFVFATIVALLVTAAIFVFLPAVSAFAHYGVSSRAFAHIRPANDDSHVLLLAALRQGRLHVIEADALTGMVTVPSFHACSAVLFAWALRRTPVFAPIGYGVNAAMLLATPTFGAHYLTDVIAGMSLAVLTISISGMLLAGRVKRGRRSTLALVPIRPA